MQNGRRVVISACDTVLYSVFHLVTLSVVETVKCANQVTCYPSDPLKRNRRKMIIEFCKTSVQRNVDGIYHLDGLEIVCSGNISLLFLFGQTAVLDINVYHYALLFSSYCTVFTMIAQHIVFVKTFKF